MGEHGRPRAESVPDTAAVHADDRLLDVLGRREDQHGVPVESASAPSPGSGHESLPGDPARSGDPVVSLLTAWRDEIDERGPLGGPDLAEAARVLPVRPVRARRSFVVGSAAAAVIGVALAAVGIGAHQAAPGDPLWGVSQTLFVNHSRSVQAAANVGEDLDQAELALSSDSPGRAESALAQARVELQAVAPEQGHAALQQRHDALVDQLVASAPTAGPAAAPSTVAAPVTTPSATAGSTATGAVPVRTTPPRPVSSTPVVVPSGPAVTPSVSPTDGATTVDPGPSQTPSATPEPDPSPTSGAPDTSSR